MSTIQAWQYTDIKGNLESSLTLNTSIPALNKASLAKGQILVQVISAALNPVDIKLPEISVIRRFLINTPTTPGLDFCGRVVATHESIKDIQEGQMVFGALSPLSKTGTLNQLTVLPATQCVPLPDGVDVYHAAAAGTAALTAYQSLVQAKTKPGSKVFINGGSGGTGTFGIQFAKAMGAEVTVTCSTVNVDLVRHLGSDTVLDYKKVDVLKELENAGPVYDIAIDNVGQPTELYEKSHLYLKPTGKFLQVNFNLRAFRRRLQPAFLGGGRREFGLISVNTNKNDLTQIGQWIKEGKVKPIVQIFEWDEVKKAFEMIRSGRAVGKVVVKVT